MFAPAMLPVNAGMAACVCEPQGNLVTGFAWRMLSFPTQHLQSHVLCTDSLQLQHLLCNLELQNYQLPAVVAQCFAGTHDACLSTPIQLTAWQVQMPQSMHPSARNQQTCLRPFAIIMLRPACA
jgi:hypothetical protein